MNQGFEKSPKLEKWLRWMGDNSRNEILGASSGYETCFGKSKTSYVRTRVYKSLALSIGILEGPTFLTRWQVCVGKLNRIKIAYP